MTPLERTNSFGWIGVGIILGFAIALGFLATKVHAAEAPVFKRGFHPKQVRVVDGDTLAVGKVRYRLFGYDTPELNIACQKDRALQAKAKLEELVVPPNRLILRVVTNRQDPYGRTIARALTGKSGTSDVSLLMRRAGLAQPYDGGTRPSWPGCQ